MFSEILKIMSNSESSGDLSKYFVTLIITIYILSNNNFLQGIDILPSPNNIPIPHNIPETIRRPSCDLFTGLLISIISGYLMYMLINFVLDIFINNDGYKKCNINRSNRNRCLNKCPFGFDINMDICKLFPKECKYKIYSSNTKSSSSNTKSSSSNTNSSSSQKKWKINEDIEKIQEVFIKTLNSELNNHIEKKNENTPEKKESIYDEDNLDDFVNIDKKVN